MMSAPSQQVLAGQAIYTPLTLRGYDLAVVSLSHRFIWQSPARLLEERYDRYITANHLELGAGTGYFLDRCHFPSPAPRIALMDLNPSTLEFASRRLARYRPETFRRNVLEPISIDGPGFDSLAINDVLHCLPGSIGSKAVAFDHLKALMNRGGVLFGSTLLQGGVRRSPLARILMELYNRLGIFSNREDDLQGLKRELSLRFREVSVDVIGCSALFSGRV